ncbi:MAG: NAD(P)-binding domain-containing protein [Myxococcota bacterium]
MKIAVLGTGVVGQTVAAKLASLGHDVAIGTRDPEATRARTEPGAFGNPSFADWLGANPTVRVATFADAAADAEMVVNASAGGASLQVLAQVGPEALAGKILVDIANPLDFSAGMPPRLSVCNDDSLGEQIQRAYPDAKVVKTLNTVNANLMVDPRQLADGEHTMFVCGDDAEAKAKVTALLTEQLGWRDVVDLGGIAMARGTEMLLPLWVRVWGATQNPMFSFRLVR